MNYDTSWIVVGEWVEHPPQHTRGTADAAARRLLADRDLGPAIAAMREGGEWCGAVLYAWGDRVGEDVEFLRDFCDGVFNTATGCEKNFPDRAEPELYRLGVLYARRAWPAPIIDDNVVDE